MDNGILIGARQRAEQRLWWIPIENEASDLHRVILQTSRLTRCGEILHAALVKSLNVEKISKARGIFLTVIVSFAIFGLVLACMILVPCDHDAGPYAANSTKHVLLSGACKPPLRPSSALKR